MVSINFSIFVASNQQNKLIMKNIFSFILIFASRIRESEIVQEDFSLYSFRQRGRFITFGFSYGFGKGEAMEFSGRKRR